MKVFLSSSSSDACVLPAAYDCGHDDESALFNETSSESSHTSATASLSPLPTVLTMPPTPPQKAVAPPRRRGKAAADPSATALKRARRSEIERNSRLRRLDELTRMRQDLLRLEYEYKRVAARDKFDALVFETEPATIGRIVASKSRAEQHRIQRRLTFTMRLLTEEQNELRKMLQEQALFEKTVRAAWKCDLSEGPDMSNLATRDPIDPSKEWVHPARCFAFLRETYELIMAFDASHAYESTGMSIMGWTDKRRLDPETGHLHYGFRKQFLGQHAEDLLTKTWDLMIDPTKMSRLLVDQTVTTESSTLQKLNDDLLIVRRDHTHPLVHMTFLTAQVIFRLQTQQGFLMCFRTIPVPEIQDTLKAHEMWFEIFNFSLFNHIYDAHGAIVGCEVVAGGSLSDPSLVTTKYWLFELVVSVLRWESTCVAPLFLMQ